MPRLGPDAKLRRVLEFMMGLRDDRVLQALAECGLTAADREKGWELLRILGSTQKVSTPEFTSEPLMALDAWRQRWLRVVRVSLVQDFPRVYDQIFAAIDDSRMPSFAVVPVFTDHRPNGGSTSAQSDPRSSATASKGTPRTIASPEKLPMSTQRRLFNS